MSPAPAEGPEVVVGDASDSENDVDDEDLPAEFAAILGLTARHIELVRAYEMSVRNASATTAPAQTCEAIAKAYDVADALVVPLLTQRDALFDDQRYDLFVAAVDRLHATLFGIGFAVGAQSMMAWVINDEFGFTGEPSAMAALSVADALVGLRPNWFRQTTDLGGCVRPQGAADALRRLTDKTKWDAAPACLKAQLGPKVRASLTSLSESLCYCEDKPTVAAKVADVAVMLETLHWLDGTVLADRLRKNASSANARFKCSP